MKESICKKERAWNDRFPAHPAWPFMNSGERIPRRLCRGVSEQDTKKVLDGIGFLDGSAARSFNVHSGKGILILMVFFLLSVNVSARNRERLVFNLKLGFIKGGEAVMIIMDTTYNDRKAVYYHLRGRTTGVTDKLFNVDNEYESILDAETYLPYHSIRNAKEKKYRYYNEVFFFQDKDTIYSEKTGWMKVPHNLTDFLTVFFYFVKQNMFNEFDQNKELEIPTLNGHEVQFIKIKFNGSEQIETKMGMVDCYVLSPLVEKGKVLRRADGVKLYISKESKIPIQLDFETKVGTLRAILESYKINGKEQIKN